MIAGRHALLSSLLREPRVRLAGLAGLAGILGFFLLGTTPAAVSADAAGESTWTLAPPAAPDVSAAKAVLDSAPLWSSQPAPATAAEAAPPPPSPPRLLGIIRVGARSARRTVEAVFLLPDGRRERAAEGARLSDGTTVERLADTRATILMADGRALELRLLDGQAAPAGP